MKFHKLVKSIDYVTHPALVELKRINNTLGNSLSSLRDILISAGIGVLFDITPVSDYLINEILKKSACETIAMFGNYPDANKIIAMFLAGLLYGILCFYRFVKVRWGSGKETVDARKAIVLEFYKVIIPNLISVKSIVEQHDETCVGEESKRFLLLLQAKYEIIEFICILDRLNVIESDRSTKVMTKDSKNVLDLIGSETYLTILIDSMHCVDNIYSRLQSCSNMTVDKTLESLKTSFFTSRAFIACANQNLPDPLYESARTTYSNVKKKMNKSKATTASP